MTTLDRVRAVIAWQMGEETVAEDKRLGEDLGCDSLDVACIEVALEAEFDFGPHDILEFPCNATVGQVAAAVDVVRIRRANA